MNEKDVEALLTALGSIAESCGVLKNELKSQGFSDYETLYLCGKYIEALCGRRQQ